MPHSGRRSANLRPLVSQRYRPTATGRNLPGVRCSGAPSRSSTAQTTPSPTGQTGEIVVRGPTVFKGYWNNEADTAFTFRNGWHHTGDMGYFDADGYLWYAGRAPEKELIKTGGENVYPAEVENAIRQHPAIADVVVIGVPDPQWSEAIKAVCVPPRRRQGDRRRDRRLRRRPDCALQEAEARGVRRPVAEERQGRSRSRFRQINPRRRLKNRQWGTVERERATKLRHAGGEFGI